jgi:hypothetical protein
MLFTKPVWETPYRFRHDPFNRWRLAGVHHVATTFIVREANAVPNDPDGYSYIVADLDILVGTLEKYGAVKPRVLAIDWETLVPVSTLWSCKYADGGRNFLAYADTSGRLRGCEPQQPDPRQAQEKVLVWTQAEQGARQCA